MKVSVIIPTYNGQTRGFLSDAITSVSQQTYKDFELLIIDDGSTDETETLCKKFLTDSRVRYVYKKNAGVAAARNTGIKESAGEYVAFLDDDDMWMPEKLEKQMALIASCGDERLGLCYTALELVTIDGTRTGVVQSHHAKGDVFYEMLCDNLVDCTSSVVIPREVLDEVGFFKEYLSYAEDYDLWLRIAKRYHLYSVDEPQVLYREHSNKLSANLDKIEDHALWVVSNFLHDEPEINKSNVYNQIHKHRAAYRFWLGDYAQFRRHARCAGAYGPLGAILRLRILCSYMPWVVQGVRRMKKCFARLTIFLIIGSCL